ncbi:hypothetical protein IKF84_00455 [Candidatus Saccharibacteria bacterium]|nr:hypothetical protein [Candidatus Saccharibacteria bacterium]
MKKTHKKILGFAGLGLVAAVTTFAATVQVPGASAVTAVSDKIQVRVLTEEPELSVTPTIPSGSETTSPFYGFTVIYNNLTNITATLVNRGDDGTVKYSGVIWNEAVSGPGEKSEELNLGNFGGFGNFTITFSGTSTEGVPIEKIITVTYKAEPEPGPEPEPTPTPTPTPDTPVVDPDVPKEETKKVVVNIYEEGNPVPVKTVTVDDPSDVENIDLSDLPDGTYRAEIITKDADGNVTGTTSKTIVKDTTPGGTATVPVIIGDPVPGTNVGEAVIIVKDNEGNVITTIPVSDPTPGSVVNVDVSTLDPGNYTIEVEYYDDSGNKIGTSSEEVTKTDTGSADIDVPGEVDTVTTVEVYLYGPNGKLARIIKGDRRTGLLGVYDADGNLLYTIEHGYSDGGLSIPMAGLPYGEYTGTMMYKNAEGKLVGDSKPLKIEWNGEAIIVPDTGSFFQGLNITREDYLITGIVVFAAVGAVAFWLVKRNRNSRR